MRLTQRQPLAELECQESIRLLQKNGKLLTCKKALWVLTKSSLALGPGKGTSSCFRSLYDQICQQSIRDEFKKDQDDTHLWENILHGLLWDEHSWGFK